MQCLYTIYSEIEECHRMVFGAKDNWDKCQRERVTDAYLEDPLQRWATHHEKEVADKKEWRINRLERPILAGRKVEVDDAIIGLKHSTRLLRHPAQFIRRATPNFADITAGWTMSTWSSVSFQGKYSPPHLDTVPDGMPGFDQLWGNLIGEELCF